MVCMHCRKKHGLQMGSRAVRELELLHLFGSDFALEQPRPLPPKVKLVGAIMPSPPKPLPQELEVSKLCAWSRVDASTVSQCLFCSANEQHRDLLCMSGRCCAVGEAHIGRFKVLGGHGS